MVNDFAVARFFVRSDGALILGSAVPSSTLKAGFVYEILDVAGTLVLREVGPSCASQEDAVARYGVTDGFTPDTILACGGLHLFTPDEVAARASRSSTSF